MKMFGVEGQKRINMDVIGFIFEKILDYSEIGKAMDKMKNI